MADTEAGIERRTGVVRLLWSNRGRILASTTALGFAAFLAGSLVPPSYRASIRLSAAPDVSAGWNEALLQDVLATAPQQAGEARSGILAAWADLIDQSPTLRPGLGGERTADGSVLIWVEDRDADDARRRAQVLADQLVERTGPVRAVVPAPEPRRTSPTIQALDDSIAEAQASLSAAQARLAEAQAEVPAPAVSNAGRRSSLDAARRAAEAARRDLQSLERFARDLGTAVPSDAPATIRGSREWIGWRDAAARRDAAAEQAAELSRTLLDGHPRMATVRLRLADLQQDLSAARARLAAALERRLIALRREVARLERQVVDAEASGGEQEAARARSTEAATEVEAAQRALEALQDARRAAGDVGADEPPPVTAAPAPTAVSTSLIENEYRPNIWPIVAGSAAFGFLASSLYAILSGLRRPSLATPPALSVRGRRRGGVRPEGREATERRASGPTFDITPADELIGGILASEISRVVIVPIGADERPSAVEIVRRLALRGRQGALVDLSERQLAARAMGVPPNALGVSDMIAGDATFAEIARRDFATQAEAFGSGQTTVGEAAFLAMERRNVLEFIERNYEVALVVCGGLPLDTVNALLTPDAALVVTVEGEDEDGIAAGVRRLRDAGLADMILADGRQLAA